MITSRRLALPVLVAVLVGCTASPPAASSSVPAPSGSGAVPGGLLPEGCESIDLRSPTGERVDLSGVWKGTGALIDSDETVWLTQVGNCVYGSAMSPGFLSQAPDESWTVVNLQGHLTSDFRMPTTAAIVIQHIPLMAVTSELTFIVDWDDAGQIHLSEDREPGEVAARCRPLPLGNCPAPLVLDRIDVEGPEPSPS